MASAVMLWWPSVWLGPLLGSSSLASVTCWTFHVVYLATSDLINWIINLVLKCLPLQTSYFRYGISSLTVLRFNMPLVCASMLSSFSCVWLFWDYGTIARQAPLSMGFPRQEYQSGLLCPPPGDLPDPGIKPMFPSLWVNYLPLSCRGSP